MIFPSKLLKTYVPISLICFNSWFFLILCQFETATAAGPVNRFVQKVRRKTPEFKGVFQETVVVDAVLRANGAYAEKGREKALQEIQDLDRKWINTLGKSEVILPYLKGPCADYLRKVQSRHKFIVEIFVTDRLGAVVCETDKTSDFWQGDEKKWQSAFNDGNGKEYISEPAFDGSTQTYSLHLSLPIFDSRGATIGVAILGVDLDEL